MDDFQFPGMPPELQETAKSVTLNLLPEKSKKKYESAYNRFKQYCQSNNTKSCSENVFIAYFSNLSSKMKSSTLWSNYSMLRSTISIKENIDISKYHKLRAFLKRQSDGYIAKKSKILTKEQIEQFIAEAPDDIFLMTKVGLIFGVAGACRREELAHINLKDIEDIGNKLLISIPDNKTNTPRSFVVNESHLNIYRKYVSFRPVDFDSYRFFFKYQNRKGWRQVVGIHQFGKMPQVVATFLKLENAKNYTGHCFRRSSATILVDSGADLTALKRHGGWKSSNVAEGYIADSLNNKTEVASRIFNLKDNSTNHTAVDVNSVHNINNPPIFKDCTNCTVTINIRNNYNGK